MPMARQNGLVMAHPSQQATRVQWQMEPAFLASIKARLASDRHTHLLFDTERYTRHVESAFTTMWEAWQRGEAPRSFSVQPIG